MTVPVTKATRAAGLLHLLSSSTNPGAPQAAGEWDRKGMPSGGTRAECGRTTEMVPIPEIDTGSHRRCW